MRPLQHIDPLWVRRGILVPLSFATIWIYLGTGVVHWWRDLVTIWRAQ